jgi:ABC-type glycerol-3-phosphate transport system substrate-binding protein
MGMGSLTQRHVSRRKLILAAASVGASAVALAACGETQVVTVDKIVTKEIPVERIITKEVPVEKVVIKEVEKVVTKEVVIRESVPFAERQVVRLATKHTSGVRKKTMEWALERFASEQPNIFVKFEPRVSGGAFSESLGIQFAAQAHPEIILFDGRWFQAWVESGAFTDLTDLLVRQGVDFDDYYEVPQFPAWASGIYKAHGRWYGMGYNASINGPAYNIERFENAGIDDPSGGWDWDELRELGRRLTDSETGSWGIKPQNSVESDSQPLARSNGIPWTINEDYTRTLWGEPESVEALQFAANLVFEDGVSYLPADSKELQGEFKDPFAAGKVGIANGSYPFFAGEQLVRIADRFPWAISQYWDSPRTGERRHVINDQPHIVTNAAQRLGTEEACAILVSFLAGEEVQARVAIDRGGSPTLKALWDSPEYQAPPPEHFDRVAKMLKHPEPTTLAWHPNGIEWNSATGAELAKMWTGDLTAEQAALAAAEAGDRVLEAGGFLPGIPA